MTTTIPSGTMHGALRAGKQPRYRVEEPRANGGHTTAAVVSAEEIAWLVAHLRAVVAASPAAWAGKGMTLLQLTALHVISAQAPVTLTDVAQALGTGPPATSAMVDRLIRTGLVSRASDPQDRRRVRLTITDHATTMIGEIDLSTARRLQATLNHMGPQGRRYLIAVLRDTVRRSAGQPTQRRPSRSAGAPSVGPVPR
jgi:DNA-binding MarR family transcriptional regulator